MANEARGEVDLVVGDKTYTLRLSVNAICDTEARTKKTFRDLVASMQDVDVIALRDIVWMLLKKHHAKEFPTAEKVGDLIDDADPAAVGEAVAKVFKINAWRANGGASNGGDPQHAPDPMTSTGAAPTSAPAESG